MTCTSTMPAGLQKVCGANFEEIKNIFILDPSVSFATMADVRSQANWITKIKTDLSVWGGKVVNSYENTTDDANTVTFASTRKRDTNRPIPSGIFMFDTNFCDTKEVLKALKNTSSAVVFELNNNDLHMSQSANGSFVPFSGTLNVLTKGLSMPSDVGNNAPVKFYGDSYDEFENGALIPMDFSLTELIKAYSPVGLNIYNVGGYSSTTGILSLQINVRCAGAKDDVAIADFEFTDSNNLDTLAVTTLGTPVNGLYDVTIQKDVIPVNLAIGDFFKFRVKVESGSDVTFVSNTLYIPVNE